MIASNRLHMAEMLDERMRRSRAKARAAGGKGDRDSAHVKTFIVEAALPEDAPASRVAKFVNETFPRVSGKQVGTLLLTPAKDDSLFTVQTLVSGEPVTAYLDVTNPRFWLLHSMGKSDHLDRLVSLWVDDLPELDRAWFPVALLESYIALGALRGIGLEYSNEWMREEDAESGLSDVFKMQLRSRQAERVLRTMRSDAGEPHTARLSKVVINAFGTIVSDIKYDGKVTGYGRSFTDHLSVISRVHTRYAQQIRHVEARYAISSTLDGGNLTLDGAPISFQLTKTIPDLAQFCEGMFAGTAPFRLWGLPVRVRDNYFRVQAVDLHSGKTVAFELMPELIRLYLPKGSCGNSVLRFYTNLQGRFDAMVTAINGDGGPVFEF